MIAKETEPADIQDLHFEHKLWLNELKFYKDELKILENRLDQLIGKDIEHDALARFEQFQNQFIHQHEIIHDVKHKIKLHQKQLSIRQNENPEHEASLEEHTELREEMQSFRSIFNELKEGFLKYLTECM